MTITKDRDTGTRWHTLSPEEVARALDVDPDAGLPSSTARSRLTEDGPNTLDRAPSRPLWRRVLRLLGEPMTVVLIVAALVGLLISGEVETPVVILVVVVFNAVLNLVQERRAENSLQALQDLTVASARVRRDSQVAEVPAEDLVVGDVVLRDAGNAVPADGRLLEAAGLEVQEAALAGESAPTATYVQALAQAEAGVGDRQDMVFMGTDRDQTLGAVSGEGPISRGTCQTHPVPQPQSGRERRCRDAGSCRCSKRSWSSHRHDEVRCGGPACTPRCSRRRPR